MFALTRTLSRKLSKRFTNPSTGQGKDGSRNEKCENVRCRLSSLDSLCKKTELSRTQLRALYRGFKQECPTGCVDEDEFKAIYEKFFPIGRSDSYAHFIFNTFDSDKTGSVTFEKFVIGLSVLARGTTRQRLRWAFNIYDLNKDGKITQEEMLNVVTAIHDMMDGCSKPTGDEECTPNHHVELIFKKMDRNKDGVITRDEFIDACMKDEGVRQSMKIFDTLL